MSVVNSLKHFSGRYTPEPRWWRRFSPQEKLLITTLRECMATGEMR